MVITLGRNPSGDFLCSDCGHLFFCGFFFRTPPACGTEVIVKVWKVCSVVSVGDGEGEPWKLDGRCLGGGQDSFER